MTIPTITSARIERNPKDRWDVPKIMVRYSDAPEADEQLLFDFYPDEISFSANEVIGLTRADAVSLKVRKDTEYLRS